MIYNPIKKEYQSKSGVKFIFKQLEKLSISLIFIPITKYNLFIISFILK